MEQRSTGARAVAVVNGSKLDVVSGYQSTYALATAAIRQGISLEALVSGLASAASAIYADIVAGNGDFRLIRAFDHPDNARCMVSGTGLTHKASALNRNAMHAKPEQITDSMRMFQWGLEGGRPEAGAIGVSPEWFYKGDGQILCGYGDPLTVPWHGEDGGEEPEIAGAYVIAGDGRPFRVGLMQGNEFSDHKFEKRNYLYLAASKLRQCAIGPELVVGAEFENLSGTVSIERKGSVLWSRQIVSGEVNMCHSLANMEHHHFKFAAHRRAGDAHVHFYGADAFSFGEGLELQQGDVMQVSFEGFGLPLRNVLELEPSNSEPVAVGVL